MIISILFVAFCAALALVVGRKVWGKPKEDDDVVWGSMLDYAPRDASAPTSEQAPWVRELTPSPVEVIHVGPLTLDRIAVRHVEHVGATEDAPAVGAIGTLAATTSDDMRTFEQQVRGLDDWSGVDQAFVDYENAMLKQRGWGLPMWPEPGAPSPLLAVSTDMRRESTQQRIDRWLSEGGDSVRHHRADARAAASETWDAPSRELPVLDSYVADRMAEAMLQA